MAYTVGVLGNSTWDSTHKDWEEAEEKREELLANHSVQVTCRLLQSKVVVLNEKKEECLPLREDTVRQVKKWLEYAEQRKGTLDSPSWLSNIFPIVEKMPVLFPHKHNVYHVIQPEFLQVKRQRYAHPDGREYYVAVDQFGREIFADTYLSKKYVLAGTHREYECFLKKFDLKDGKDARYIQCVETLYGIKASNKQFVRYGTWAERTDTHQIMSYVACYWKQEIAPELTRDDLYTMRMSNTAGTMREALERFLRGKGIGK